MKPEDLLDKTKAYQFIKQTDSRNDVSKLKKPEDIVVYEKMKKALKKVMDWHLKRIENK